MLNNMPEYYEEDPSAFDGAEFFPYKYGYSFCLYSIEKMISEYKSLKNYCDVDYILKNCYPIGYVVDIGTLLLGHSKLGQTNKENVLLWGI
ncbi:hypothetical protein ABET36_09215 [Caldifermentibacillus hisashii]|uniref:hypothetical protein n=1 Tax=Caldifermentibacillus hisashii TaxID=996558 RepID=UPI003D1BDE94